MLTLNDGRAELWQWDTGRTLAVDADCSQVHFSNKVFGRSIDVDVVDGAAIIPDILLQTDKYLNAWAFVGTSENGYTKISKTFTVNRRNKPADYVFTPTDQMTLQTIQSQIGDLSGLTTEAKDTLVAAINEVARSGGGAGSMDLRVEGGYVQYSRDGGMTWANLIAMEDLKGKDGSDATVTAASIAGALGYTPAAPSDIPVVPAAEIRANTAARHSHANKGVLDGITAEKTSEWDAKAGTAVATASANGLMSKDDKTKLDGIEEGANKTTVDAALDATSTNPVQNKVIYAALAAKAERVNSAERTVRVEISGAFIYVYFFSGSGYWVRLCFQSRSANGQNYTITRLNGVRASKDRNFGNYITIVPEGQLEYVFAARIGGSNGTWVGGFAHGYENATKTVISLDSIPLTGNGTYYGRELWLEQTSEIYNPTGGAKIADHYVLNTITADDGWRVTQTVKWVSAVTLSKDTYLCMFALTRNALAKMARNYDYTLYAVPAYGESNATLGAKVDASACVTTGEIDCEVMQIATSGNDCHLFYSDNTYKDHYKVYFRFITGETEIASGTVFSSKFRVAFNSQLSAVSRNVIHGDEYYTKDETEAKIAELLGVVENGTY